MGAKKCTGGAPAIASSDAIAWAVSATTGKAGANLIDGFYYLTTARTEPAFWGGVTVTDWRFAWRDGAPHPVGNEVSDSDSPFPHMLPSEAKFASRMQSLGARVLHDDVVRGVRDDDGVGQRVDDAR